MKIIHKHKKNTFLLRREMFFSLILSCLFIVLVMCFTLVPLFTSTQQKSTTKYMTSQLKQITYSANVMFDEAKNVINTTYTDASVREAMYTSDVNRIYEVNVVERLRAIKSSHSYVRFIGFYNQKLDRYISTGGVFSNFSNSGENYEELIEKTNFVGYPRLAGAQYPFMEEKVEVYTFNFTPEASRANRVDNFITVDMDAKYLQTLINNMSVSSEKQQIMVVDDNGVIVSHTRPDLFLSLVSNTGFYDELSMPENKKSEGSFVYYDETGEKSFLTFVKSKSNGWMYISTQPYNTVVENTWFITLLTLLLAVVLILLGVVFAKYMVNRIHTPIKKLYDTFAVDEDEKDSDGKVTDEVGRLGEVFEKILSKAKVMENSFNSSISVVRFSHLKFLIEGDMARVDRSLNVYDELKISLKSPYYAMIVIEYCNFSDFKKNVAPKDQILYGYAIENISTELLLELTNTDFVRLSESRFAGILHLENEQVPDMLEEALEQIVDVMANEFKCEIRACIGTVVNSYVKISKSFNDCKLAIKQRVVDSGEKVINAEDILNRPKVKQFPISLQNKLIDNIRQLDREGIAETYDEIILYLRDISWNYCVDYSKQILFSIMSRFDSVTKQKEERQQELLDIIKKVEEAQSDRDITVNSKNFIELVISYLSEGKRESGVDIVEKVKEYTVENYSNASITLNYMAEMVGLSPAYFGRMFANNYGMSYIDYLNGVRLEKATLLLKTTNHPISEVSEMVGISNSNYFYTIFKKKYDMTPAAYRKVNKTK